MGIANLDGKISGKISSTTPTVKGNLVNRTPTLSGALSTMPSGIDYEKGIINKPSIEKHVLVGDSTIEQIGVGTLTVQEIEKILYLD